MEYNSKREELIIPEYGRHVQGLIRHARTISDREERQAFVERVVGLMMQMHPQNRNLEDHREKLWRHVFEIAEYDLDISPPIGEIPTPESAHKKPDPVPYPPKDTRFRHYGNNVQKLIAKAIAMEDGTKKDGFIQTIGSYMKLAYRTWNKEHYVSDDLILEDLKTLSQGKLELVDDMTLDNLSHANMRRSPIGGDRDRDRRGRGGDRRGKGGDNGKGGRGGRGGGRGGGGRRKK
ncbi:MAG: DUF4290 domain-containing protein [Bacteroidota bacterium]